MTSNSGVNATINKFITPRELSEDGLNKKQRSEQELTIGQTSIFRDISIRNKESRDFPMDKDKLPTSDLKNTNMEIVKKSNETFSPNKLPYANKNLLSLQTAAMIALLLTVALNFYITKAEDDILGDIPGFTDYILWNTPLTATIVVILIGLTIGGFSAFLKSLRMKKNRAPTSHVGKIIGIIVVIGLFYFVMTTLDNDQLDFIFEEPYNTYVIIPILFISLVIIYSSAIFLGVYGLLTGKKGAISMSSYIIFIHIMLSFSRFSIESDNLVRLFFEEIKITIFSLAYLAYLELSYAVLKFSKDWCSTTQYDVSTGTTTFTDLLGKIINVYIFFFIQIILITYFIVMSSNLLGVIFATIVTPSIKESIEYDTIYSKMLFILLFFGLICLIKSGIPEREEYINVSIDMQKEDVDVLFTSIDGKGNP